MSPDSAQELLDQLNLTNLSTENLRYDADYQSQVLAILADGVRHLLAKEIERDQSKNRPADNGPEGQTLIEQ